MYSSDLDRQTLQTYIVYVHILSDQCRSILINVRGHPLTNVEPLFEELKLEQITLKNRIAMAPMARNYAPDFIPNETNAAYYARRAEHVGLVISEASFIDHPVSSGHKGQPAIFGGALDGYKKVITAVHAVGGKMFCQLWHMGPERPDGGIPNPELPAVSPSGLRDTDKPHGVALSLSLIHISEPTN